MFARAPLWLFERLKARRDTLQSIQDALRGGVHAVNLCALPGLSRELYTYEGSGTLFTLEDYCQVDRLGIDDFEEVERLLGRGQREGFLKLRGEDETARILLNGGKTAESRIEFATMRALSRPPTPQETDVLTRLCAEQLRAYEQAPEDAEALLAVGLFESPEKLDPAELAAWTQVARALLNTQEAITRY